MKQQLSKRLDDVAAGRGMMGRLLFRFSVRFIRSYLSSGIYASTQNGEGYLLEAAHRFRPLRTVIDVGANVGDWTALLRTIGAQSTRVHCFEAAPPTALRLAERFRQDPNTSVHAMALSDRCESLEFRYWPLRSDMSTFVLDRESTKDGTSITVDAITGESFCGSQGIDSVDLLKVDCEGHDLAVLRGFGTLIDRCSLIQFEHNEFGMRAGITLADFEELLLPTHYVGRLTAGGVLFDDVESQWVSKLLPGNFVAVNRREPALLSALQRFARM